jgi:hypothetical protein
MAYKKKPANKTEKKVVVDKAPKAASIDWDSLPTMVTIIFNGKETSTHKSNAKLLVEKGVAKLK